MYNILKSQTSTCSIGKAIREGWKLSGGQEGLVLMRGSAKIFFDINIKTKNGVISCAYVQRDQKISAILTSTGAAMSIEKTHIMTKNHDEEQTSKIAL